MNHIAHFSLVSDNRITKQALKYPIFAEARSRALQHNRIMTGFAFDAEKVRAAMRDRGINQSELAKAVGLPSQSAVSNILKGERQVKVDEARKIYSHLRIVAEDGTPALNVPIIGLTSAGSWREAIEMPIGTMSIPRAVAGPRSFAVEVRGDSMDLLIDDGGYVVVDPDRKELIEGKCYLIQNRDFEVTAKAYFKNPSRFEPMSSNDQHGPIAASDVDVILGRIVWKGAPV